VGRSNDLLEQDRCSGVERIGQGKEPDVKRNPASLRKRFRCGRILPEHKKMEDKRQGEFKKDRISFPQEGRRVRFVPSRWRTRWARTSVK